MLTVSVTGGTGYIGARLVRLHLEHGDTVRILTRSSGNRPFPAHRRLEYIRGDILRPSDELHLLTQGCDILYHCAGEVRDQGKMEKLHCQGTQCLIRHAAGCIGHWVQLGSVGSYGSRQQGTITESTPPAPEGTYEVTKTQSDKLVMNAARQGHFSCTILRPSIVFGPTMPNQSLFQLISAIDKGLFFFIGPPGSTANYVHVDNVAEALLRCGTRRLPGCTVFNLSDHCTMEYFVATIARLLGRTPPTRRIPLWSARLIAGTLGRLPGFPLTGSRIDALTSRTVYSMDAICSVLGYCSRVTLDEGLAQMVAAWRNRKIPRK